MTPLPPCGDGISRGEVPQPSSTIQPSSPPGPPPDEVEEGSCVETFGAESIQIGSNLYHIFNADGNFRFLHEECEVDCLLVAAGAAVDENGEDSVLWASLEGEALNPSSDTPPAAHRAIGGGRGGLGEQNGAAGGSGGGGGAQSPAFSGGATAGGIGFQGGSGGPGSMNLGLFTFPRRAASGGGGGPGGAGEGGFTTSRIARGGRGGPGLLVPNWPNIFLGKGGDGVGVRVEHPDSTGQLRGGPGSGGWTEVLGFTAPVGILIPITVASGGGSLLAQGGGGRGIVILRERVVAIADTPAVVTGGDEVLQQFGWQYHIFRNSNDLVVTSPGWTDVLVIGGGGGGGRGIGGGGGAGEPVFERKLLIPSTQQVSVGQGGGSGEDGLPTTIGDLISARGGGRGGGFASANGGQGASGGGGAGPSGEFGEGEDLAGSKGGDGSQFIDSTEEEIFHGAGGGGSSGPGQDGPIEDAVPLDEDWVLQGGEQNFFVEEERLFSHLTTGHALARHVEAGEMFVQGIVHPTPDGTAIAGVGIWARAVENVDFESDSVEDGYFLKVRGVGVHPSGIHYRLDGTDGPGVGHSTGRIADFPVFHAADVEIDNLVQFYVANSLQEGWCQGHTASATDTRHNDENLRRSGTQLNLSNCDHVLTMRSKYIFVDGVPAGWKARIIDWQDRTIAEAGESSGVVAVDCSRFGGAMDGFDILEGVPKEGFQVVELLDDLDAVVAIFSSGRGIYPGAEISWDGSELDWSDPDNPENGLLDIDDFSTREFGPEQGHGGDGIEVESEFIEPTEGDNIGNILEQPGSGGSSDRRAITWDEVGAVVDVDLMTEYRLGSGSLQRYGFLARKVSEDTYYRTEHVRGVSGQPLRLFKTINGSVSLIAQVNKSFPSFGVHERMRLRVIGNSIQVKIWSANQPEPVEWDIDEVDSDIQDPGAVGVLNISSQGFFGWFSVGVGGVVAPEPRAYETLANGMFFTDFREYPTGEFPADWTPALNGTGADFSVEDIDDVAWPTPSAEPPVINFPNNRVSAGGGGGSTAERAGEGGLGGGGDGSTDLSDDPGEAGADDTGSGGGGSGRTTRLGGKGGNGIGIVRIPIPTEMI